MKIKKKNLKNMDFGYIIKGGFWLNTRNFIRYILQITLNKIEEGIEDYKRYDLDYEILLNKNKYVKQLIREQIRLDKVKALYSWHDMSKYQKGELMVIIMHEMEQKKRVELREMSTITTAKQALYEVFLEKIEIHKDEMHLKLNDWDYLKKRNDKDEKIMQGKISKTK